MPGVTSPAGLIHLGMDTSKDTIVAGVLLPGEQIPAVDRISNDEEQVRRLAGRLGDRALLRACYEAGPGGYDLHRLLASMGVACEVVAPSLIPKGGSDRVKTGKRDAVRLARLHRAGELTPIRVPSPAEEAVRDLVRVRSAVLAGRKRAQQRLTAMLIRHGRIWRSTYWTGPHRAWIAAQSFGEPAVATALAHYRATLDTRESELACIESELAPGPARPAGRRGHPALLLPGHRRADRPDPGCRDSRLAPVPGRPGVHGLHRAGPRRVLQRRPDLARAHHQGRVRAGAHRPDRGSPGLPLPAGDRGHPAPPPGRRRAGHHRPVLEGAAAAARQVPAHGQRREGRPGGGHRDRPRAGRVRLGRDDQLSHDASPRGQRSHPGTRRAAPPRPPEPVAYRDARRCRNDPRQICERSRDSRPE